MPPERPSSPEAIKPSFVEQKAKEVREDLADLLESSDFSGEIQKLEQRFGEKLDREGFIEAFSHIYLAIVEGRLLGNEEQVTFEILDAIRTRSIPKVINLETWHPTEEFTQDALWLRTLTGQIVAGFMKALVDEQNIQNNQKLDPIFEQLNQVDRSTSEERRFETADAFFKASAHSAKSMLTRLLDTSALFVQELETTTTKDEKGETKVVRSEFILPWVPMKQIPPLETLQDPMGGYRMGGYGMVGVSEDGYFPQGEPRRREDFELTSKHLDLIEYPKEKRSSLLAELQVSHKERFPFCMVFDIKEAQGKYILTSRQILEVITEGKGKRFKYIPASIDHHLALAAFGWDEMEDADIVSLGSALDVGGLRCVPRLRRDVCGRRLDFDWFNYYLDNLNRFLVLRKSSS